MLATDSKMMNPFTMKNGKRFGIVTVTGILKCNKQFKRLSISLHFETKKNWILRIIFWDDPGFYFFSFSLYFFFTF